MFTSLAPLSQRIERLIDETTKVDPHTHIRCDRPSAPDLASLMSYHWVMTELIAVGLPAEDMVPSLPPEERVRRALPYLRRMRNTAMSWCFRRILRDLYDFHDRELDASNLSAVLDAVQAKGADPSWPSEVVRKRCNVATIVTSLGNQADHGPPLGADVFHMLDAHYLFCPGVATDLEPFFCGRTTKQAYGEAPVAVLGGWPSSPSSLEQGVHDWLGRTVTGPVRFSNTFIPIEQRFRPADPTALAAILERRPVGGGQVPSLGDADIDELVRGVTWAVLGWHHEHRKAFQIAVGAEYFICDGKSIPRFQETWTSDLARTFHAFPNARFDLMMASDVLAQDVAVLARQFPNVYTSGYWWHSFFPSLIERVVGLRMQVAPMTKFSGFLSDAYSVEWAYGKLQVVKKAMASALVTQVEGGFLEEDELPAVLKQVLHETPRALYDLHDSPAAGS